MTLPPNCDNHCEYQQNSVTTLIEDLDPAYIGEGLAHIGGHIRQLLGVQALLHRHHNLHHSYIYALPPEVLDEIFLWTCTFRRGSWEEFGGPTRGQAMVLSSVSSYWRSVALQTPRLWSTVTFDVREPTSETKAALLQHHIKYGTDLDISMHLSTDVRPRQTANIAFALQFQSIADILFAPESVCKITSLRIEYPPPEWLTKIPWLPHLHTLVLTGLRGQQSTPVSLNLRRQPLCRVRLSVCSRTLVYGPLNLPPTVQELFTSGLKHEITSGFLYRFPNLTKFRASNPSDPPGSYFISNPTTRFIPHTLSHLEDLTWPVGDFLYPTLRLSLPALKSLHLVDPDESTSDGYISQRHFDSSPGPILSLSRHLSATLKSLELVGSRWTTQALEQLFLTNITHLEALVLVEWPLDFLITALQVLTPREKDFNQHVPIKALPRLRSLVIRANMIDYSTPDTGGPTSYSSLQHNAVNIAQVSLKMLERRRAGQVDPFLLGLPPLYKWENSRYLWSARLRHRFRRVVRARYLDIRQEQEEERL